MTFFNLQFNKFILVIFLAVFLTQITYSQQNFEKKINVNGYASGACIKQLANGGFIIMGTTKDSNDSRDFLLLETDSIGNIVWNKSYGSDAWEVLTNGIIASDSGYIMVGWRKNKNNITDQIHIIKTDKDGNQEWFKKIYGKGNEGRIVETNNSEILMTYSNFRYENCLTKLSNQGDSIWTRKYNPDFFCSSIIQTNDFHYMLIGHTAYDNLTYIRKIDENGTVIWEKTIGNWGSFVFTNKIIQAGDNSFYIVGYVGGKEITVKDICVARISQAGDSVWSKTYGGNNADYGRDIVFSNNGNITIAAYTESFGDLNGDVQILQLDKNGDSIWSKVFGGAFYDNPSDIIQTKDNGYMIVGQTSSSIYDWKIYLIKTNEEVNSNNVSELKNKTFSISPNPVSEFINVKLENKIEEGIIHIYNSLGKHIKSLKINGNNNQIDIRELEAGIYVLVVKTEKNLYSKKFIKE
jgi:hypothetical protein